MADVSVPVPNMGFELALSDYKVEPVEADVIGDIQSITGMGFTINTVDATAVSSTTGFTRPVAVNKEGKPFTVTLFKSDSNFQSVFDRVIGVNPVEEDFYCSVTTIFPKRTGYNDAIPDYTYHGFISEISFGDADTSSVQTVSFVFTPNEEPTEFSGFTTGT